MKQFWNIILSPTCIRTSKST